MPVGFQLLHVSFEVFFVLALITVPHWGVLYCSVVDDLLPQAHFV
jgi:hypothetical protein